MTDLPLFDFKRYADALRTRVDAALLAALPVADDTTGLREAMRYSLFNGGKRVRPLLVYASAQAINDAIELNRLDAIAGAVEALHSYSLVHDDLPAMDDDDLRRGKPTCHIAFGEANAILAGDGLNTFAFELLANADFDAATRIAMIQALALGAGHAGMILGQAIDLASVDKTITLECLEHMHRHKTGALISASTRMGALAAGADNAQLNALAIYADAVGLAFQVQDDILDVIGDTEALGKQSGADAARNKPTYVSLLGLAGARDKLAQLHATALDALAPFGKRAQALRALADFIVARTH